MKRIANNLKAWKNQVLVLMLLLFSQLSFAQQSTYNYGDSIVISNDLTGWSNTGNENAVAWKSNNTSEITFSSFSTNSNKVHYYQSPGIKVEKGKLYSFRFSYKGKNAGSKFHTFLTTSNDGSTSKAKLEEYTVGEADVLYTEEVTLAITNDNTYYIGFASEDNSINNGIAISDVKVIEYGTWKDEILLADKQEPKVEEIPTTPISNKKDSTKPKKPHTSLQNVKPSQKEAEKLAKEENPQKNEEEQKAEESVNDSAASVVDTINTVVNESTTTPEVVEINAVTEKETGSTSYTLLYIILGIVALILAFIAFYINRKNNHNSEIIADQQLAINRMANAARIRKEQPKVVAPAPKEDKKIVVPENFEITEYTKEIAAINTFHKKVSTHLQELIDETSSLQQRKTLVGLKNEILNYNDALLTKDFAHNFSVMHPVFFEKLLKIFPQLSKADLTLCSYLYLGLSTKEIASLTDREVRSIESARNRLRKKINLEAGEDFNAYFTEIENS